ncbi:MAG: methyltransferase domain-containing protein, partial [Anaerolineae bacterium]|nr:methyltransferase domain-containing protein [Anaerolineae bacterium]
SEGMVARARALAAEAGLQVPFVVAGFGHLAEALPGPFDAVLCLGNSLPHLLSAPEVHAALADLAAVLRPGGLLVVQNRNYDRVWTHRERFMPLQVHREGEREWLFFRFMDWHESTLSFNVVTLERSGGQWSYRVGATELRPILQAELAAFLPQAGFAGARFYGDYRGGPFDPQASTDLIVVATRGNG